MSAQDDGPSYIDEHHQRIAEFANDYLDEEDREAFVDGLLEKHGYVRMTAWGPPADPPRNPKDPKKRPGFYGGRR